MKLTYCQGQGSQGGAALTDRASRKILKKLWGCDRSGNFLGQKK
jgi:hypothetical protein